MTGSDHPLPTGDPSSKGESINVANSTLKVWAPAATRVAAVIDGETRPLAAGSGGWWHGPRLEVGQRYGFVLDEHGTVLPDPRSRRLPDGVHGLSAVDDPAAFAWTDQAWQGASATSASIYELHVGTFSQGNGPGGAGTLDSAIAYLDELVDLGVTAIEPLPVNAFNGDWNWGYDGVAWFAVAEVYGGPTGYRRFVDAAHARGLAVIQDVVYNHLGPSGNYLPQFAPYLRSGLSNTWGESVNLDEEEVRRYILDNVAMWLRDFHVDGLRLDAVHALHDMRRPHLLAQIGALADDIAAERGFAATIIAESDLNDPIMFKDRDAGGYGLAGQWSDDFHHALHVALSGETTGYYADFAEVGALAKVLSLGFFHDGTWSSFRGNFHGRHIDPAESTSHLVIAAQNHDQIGNRAAGDRLTALVSDERLAIAATVTIASPFTPMLFMGEEWGARTPWQFFTSHPELDLGEKVARGRIAEFERMGWDETIVPNPQDPETFFRSRLDRSELADPSRRTLRALYRTLLALRRDTIRPHSVRFGDLRAESFRNGTVTILRWPGWMLAVNLSAKPFVIDHAGELVFSSVRGLQIGIAMNASELLPEEAIVARSLGDR